MVNERDEPQTAPSRQVSRSLRWRNAWADRMVWRRCACLIGRRSVRFAGSDATLSRRRVLPRRPWAPSRQEQSGHEINSRDCSEYFWNVRDLDQATELLLSRNGMSTQLELLADGPVW